MKKLYEGRKVEAIVDVWCEAPQSKLWKEFADAALTPEGTLKNWSGIEYWFAMGVHPHDAEKYTDEIEKDILEAMAHPRCVSWGEMGLDYHYDHSPRDIQKLVFTRQLRLAVKLGKPLTIHTREAEEDTEVILKEEVPKDHRIHIHCFTDSPDFAQRLLAHFPNLYIGITGVVTYSSNTNTSDIVRAMVSSSPSAPLRILLETDAPYMVPGNIYASLNDVKGRLPICHTAMLPWTAAFVANVAGKNWTADSVMSVARENAKKVYSI